MSTNSRKYLWNERSFLVMIALVGLCVRIIWFVGYTRYEKNYEIAIDSGQYHEIAVQVANNKGITTKDNQPNFFRLPGYPVFLAGLYKVFGDNPVPSMVVQCLLSTIIPILMFFVASALLPGNLLAARLAGLAAALHPGFILFAGMQASETMFLIFFLFFLFLLFKGIDSGYWGYFCTAGLVLGIASLVRALGHYVVVLSIVLIVLLASQSLYKRLRNASILFASWFLIVGIWIARNYMLTGLIFLHTLTAQHFLRYNVVYNIMETEKITYSLAKHKIFTQRDELVAQEALRIGRALSEPEVTILTGKLVFNMLLQHPFLTIKYACLEVIKLCKAHYYCEVLCVPQGVIFGPTATLSYKIKMYCATLRTYPIIIPFVLWNWLFDVVLIIGMILSIFFGAYGRDKVKVLIITLTFIVLLISLTSSVGLVRLRLPVEPFFILLASYGWVNRFPQACLFFQRSSRS